MLRESTYNGILREYKNGNITIKFCKDDLEEIEAGHVSDVEVLSWVLENLDCYFIGDTYCLSNWETGHTLYNAYSDLVYIFPWALLEDLKAGKTVRVYSRKPDEYDRELLANEGY